MSLKKKDALSAERRNLFDPKPSAAEMVTTAIKELHERPPRGTSLIAIKRFITENYEVRMEKCLPSIKKFLRNAVDSGILIQTGSSISSSFRFSNLLSHHVVKSRKKGKIVKKCSRPRGPRGPYKKKKLELELISAGGAVVVNEPVKEEIAKQELNLIDDESDEGDAEDDIEVKEEDV